MKIELPDQLASRLSAHAASAGLSVEEFALKALRLAADGHDLAKAAKEKGDPPLAGTPLFSVTVRLPPALLGRAAELERQTGHTLEQAIMVGLFHLLNRVEQQTHGYKTH